MGEHHQRDCIAAATRQNKPEHFILAIAEFIDAETHKVHYLCWPFQREPDFNAVTVDYDFAGLLARAGTPR